MDTLIITPEIIIPMEEVHFTFITSSGPGGQNVNKVATGVQLRFNVSQSPSLTEQLRNRIVEVAAARITKEGELVIQARRFRSQDRNRQDALNRLVVLIQEAAQIPPERRPTKPSASNRAARRRYKQKRSAIKQQRKRVDDG